MARAVAVLGVVAGKVSDDDVSIDRAHGGVWLRQGEVGFTGGLYSSPNRSKHRKIHHKDTKFTKIRINPVLVTVFLASSWALCLCGEFCFAATHSGRPREASFALTERCPIAARLVYPIVLSD
jgi:hypothetical protein